MGGGLGSQRCGACEWAGECSECVWGSLCLPAPRSLFSLPWSRLSWAFMSSPDHSFNRWILSPCYMAVLVPSSGLSTEYRHVPLPKEPRTLGEGGEGKTGVQPICVISVCGKCSEGRVQVFQGVQDALPEGAVSRLSSGESGAWGRGRERPWRVGSACARP